MKQLSRGKYITSNNKCLDDLMLFRNYKMISLKIKASGSQNSVQQILMAVLDVSASVIDIIDSWQLQPSCPE